MSETFTVACVQLNSGPDLAANIEQAIALIRDARTAGAELIILPECMNVQSMDRDVLLEHALEEPEDKCLAALTAVAAELDVWLLVGSLGLRQEQLIDEKGPGFSNCSFMVGADGQVRDRYIKIHLNDCEFANGEFYRESQACKAGQDAVVTDTPWGPVGMSIGYDFHFPNLYRRLAQAKAKYFAVPAAIPRPSGKAHWHVLMRARAIENGCFVFAAAQCGDHGRGRLTYGHSVIVNPWGEVLADGGQNVGFILAEIDPREVDVARSINPSLSDDKDYKITKLN